MLLRCWGIIFILSGTAGLGKSLICQNRKHIRDVEQVLYLMCQLVQGIAYEKYQLMVLCQQMKCRLEEPFSTIMETLEKNLSLHNGQSIDYLWESCFRKHMNQTQLNKDEQDNLCRIGQYFFASEQKNQVALFSSAITYFENRKETLEKDLQAKNKVTMSVTMIAGCLICLVLL